MTAWATTMPPPDKQRASLFMTLAQPLADERQHGGIGEMEQGDRSREDQQRPRFENHAQGAGPRAAVVGIGRFIQTARERMVSGAGIDRQIRAGAQQREKDRQPKHRNGSDPIAGEAREDGGDDISGVAECFVAADPACESLPPDAAKADRGDGRRERRIANSDDRLSARNRPEGRKKGQHADAHCDDDRGGDDQAALAQSRIDIGAGGTPRRDRGDSADRHDEADMRRVPLSAGPEVDREKGPDAALHIGKQEIGPIQSRPVPHA